MFFTKCYCGLNMHVFPFHR